MPGARTAQEDSFCLDWLNAIKLMTANQEKIYVAKSFVFKLVVNQITYKQNLQSQKKRYELSSRVELEK